MLTGMQNNDWMYAREVRLNRRAFLAVCAASAAVLTRPARARQASADPWPAQDLVQPSDLAKELASSPGSLHIICVTFPVMYRQKHLPHAQLAGPTSKPEGIAKLHEAVQRLEPTAPIVIYCGCCPMNKCPNIRPAYRALKSSKFENVRVLNLPDNLHTDWTAKGYPVET
jgi:thiosulfate/3-mercaptopyruvate sulfurtransferase